MVLLLNKLHYIILYYTVYYIIIFINIRKYFNINGVTMSIILGNSSIQLHLMVLIRILDVTYDVQFVNCQHLYPTYYHHNIWYMAQYVMLILSNTYL